MITRLLLAVDDSPGALAAARVAVDRGARPRVLNVVHDGELAERLAAASGSPGLRERRDHAAAAVPEHIGEFARRSGVEVETCQLEGPRCGASSARPRPGPPT
jgi:hypothetical protein